MNQHIDQVRQKLQSAETIEASVSSVSGFSAGDASGIVPPSADDAATPPEITGASYPLNDIGNGQRFVLYHGENVLRVPRVGWFVWNSKAWGKDEDELSVRKLAQDVSARMMSEIEHIALDEWQRKALNELPLRQAEVKRLNAEKDPDETALLEAIAKRDQAYSVKKYLSQLKRDHRAFAKSTGNTSKIDAMLKEGGIHISHPLENLDRNPLVVNVDNGTLWFSVDRGSSADPKPPIASVELAEHRRDDLLTKCIQAQFGVAGRDCPTFHSFMERIQPDPEMRSFIQRSLGLAMTSITVQHLWFFYGSGANGKSVLIDLVSRILGDYSATANIESLTGESRRGGADATPDLIPLVGARFVSASEGEEGQRLKEATIKRLTGGEDIMVRQLHGEFFTVKPEFKLFLSSNHKPEIRGTDDGIWRRLLLVPFDVQIPEEERDLQLGEKLWAERDGILNWLVDGLLAYLECGLQIPESVRSATQTYREESDPMGSFLTHCCEVDGSADTWTAARDLVRGFNWWLVASGDTAWKDRTVQLKLKDKADRWTHPASKMRFTASKNSIKGYRGLKLSSDFQRKMDDFPEAEKYRESSPAQYGNSLDDF